MPDRLCYFDNLRIIVVLLVALLHAFLPFSTQDFYPYLIKNTQTFPLYNYLICLLHAIVMPVFYLIAGFFSHHIILEKGKYYFANYRLVQLGIPLLIGMLLWLPLHGLAYLNCFIQTLFQEMRTVTSPNHSALFYQTLFETAHNGTLGKTIFNLEYFWFLYYLLLFSTINLLILQCFSYLRTKYPFLLRLFQLKKFTLTDTWIILFSFLYLIIINLLTEPRYIIIPQTFSIEWQVLLDYGLFYGIGWIWYGNLFQQERPSRKRRDGKFIPKMPRNAKFMTKGFLLRFNDGNAANSYSIGKFPSLNLRKKSKSETSILRYLGYSLIAVLALSIYVYELSHMNTQLLKNTSSSFIMSLLLSSALLFSTLALYRLSWRYLNKSYIFSCYLSQRAYWIYLVGIPCQLPIQYAMIQLQLPVIMQIIAGWLAAVVFGIMSYPLIMRYDICRKVLKGKYFLLPMPFFSKGSPICKHSPI